MPKGSFLVLTEEPDWPQLGEKVTSRKGRSDSN